MNIIVYSFFSFTKNLITQLIEDEDDQNSRTKSQLLGKYFKDDLKSYLTSRVGIIFELSFPIMHKLNIIQ